MLICLWIWFEFERSYWIWIWFGFARMADLHITVSNCCVEMTQMEGRAAQLQWGIYYRDGMAYHWLRWSKFRAPENSKNAPRHLLQKWTWSKSERKFAPSSNQTILFLEHVPWSKFLLFRSAKFAPTLPLDNLVKLLQALSTQGTLVVLLIKGSGQDMALDHNNDTRDALKTKMSYFFKHRVSTNE